MFCIRFFLTLLAVLFLSVRSSAEEIPVPERDARELGLNGTLYVTHDSPEDLFGVVTVRGGYYVARKQQVGIDATLFAYSRIQDAYVGGYYRYLFARPDRRLAPFFGISAGANVSQFAYVGSQHSLIVKGELGVRYRMTRQVGLDVAYNLMYRRQNDMGFTGSTTSVITFGFSRTF